MKSHKIFSHLLTLRDETEGSDTLYFLHWPFQNPEGGKNLRNVGFWKNKERKKIFLIKDILLDIISLIWIWTASYKSCNIYYISKFYGIENFPSILLPVNIEKLKTHWPEFNQIYRRLTSRNVSKWNLLYQITDLFWL